MNVTFKRNTHSGAPSPLYASVDGSPFFPVVIHHRDKTVGAYQWTQACIRELSEELAHGGVAIRATRMEGQAYYVVEPTDSEREAAEETEAGGVDANLSDELGKLSERLATVVEALRDMSREAEAAPFRAFIRREVIELPNGVTRNVIDEMANVATVAQSLELESRYQRSRFSGHVFCPDCGNALVASTDDTPWPWYCRSCHRHHHP